MTSASTSPMRPTVAIVSPSMRTSAGPASDAVTTVPPRITFIVSSLLVGVARGAEAGSPAPGRNILAHIGGRHRSGAAPGR